MGSTASFSIGVEPGDGSIRLALRGELDAATVPLLENHLVDMEATEILTITLDLRELTFIDSVGLHAFVGARDRAAARGRRLILAEPGEPVRRLIDLVGSEFLLESPLRGDAADHAERTSTESVDADA